MANEADDNLNLEPAATRELIDAALEVIKSQGLDINPYSVAREAGIYPETLFTNSELMTMVITARGDQSTFSIDSHLVERCQELEGEMAKLLEVNQENYDQAVAMEERIIQLEAKIADMEQDTEQLTMQLQNSWHLGYKKGLNDGQSQETKASQKPLIDLELSKEEVAEKEAQATKSVIDIELPEAQKQSSNSLIDIELPEAEKQSSKSLLDIELPEAEKQSSKSLLDIELPEAQKQSSQSLLDIELPEAQKQSSKSLLDIDLPEVQKLSHKSLLAIELPETEKQSIKSLLDIELPEAEKQSSKSLLDIELPEAQKQSSKSLLDIELPEAQKQSSQSLLDIDLPEVQKLSHKSLLAIELPETEKQSIKSLLDIELPEAEKQSIKSLLDIELPEAEKQSIKSLLDIELPAAEKQSIKSLLDIELPEAEKQSSKSLIDIELPKKEAASQTDFSADEGSQTVGNPTIAGDQEPASVSPAAAGHDSVAAEMPPPAVAIKDPGAAASYNERIFNAVAEGFAPGTLPESYGGLSWREVETIYQYSASGSSSGQNLVFEPLAPGQAAGARGAEPVEGKGLESQTVESGATEGGGTVTARDEKSKGAFGPRDTQPIPPSSDNEPSLALNSSAAGAPAPPILKADAPGPRPAAPNIAASAPTTSETAAAPEAAIASASPGVSHPASAKPNPRTTYTNLTGRPLPNDLDPPMERTMTQFLGDSSSYLNLDRVTMQPAADASPPPAATAAAPAAAAGPTATAAPAPSANQAPSPPSQQETQTLAGATQALAAESKARAAADSQAGSAAARPASVEAQSATIRPTGPTDAKWGKRQTDVTYDGLSAMDPTSDDLDLEKLDIFEGMEDIDELTQIEVIEDVVLPGMSPTAKEEPRKKYNTADHIPVVSSDDLHDLIKSRIKKAEEPHEHQRVDGFLSPGAADKGSGLGTSSSSGTHAATGPGAGSGASAAPGAEPSAPSIPTAKELEALRQGARNKFVGGKATAGSPIGGGSSAGGDSPIGASGASSPSSGLINGLSPRAVPPEIRKACMILGVRPEDLTLKEVNEKWKAQLSAPGVHPDQGGDTESAIYLNTAKDTLVKWINDQNSKMGKKFKPKDDKDK